MAPTSATTKKRAAAPAANTSKKRKAAEDVAPAAKKAKGASRAHQTTQTTSKKRKAADDPAPPAKKTKTLTHGSTINEPPTERLHVYVFGSGESGELGLGNSKKPASTNVKRPRLNPFLPADTVGVTQAAAGGMHVVALTHDSKVLTWGVNDQGTLGRDTTWDGGLKDMDAASVSSDDDEAGENGLNPKESTPGEVDWSTTELAPGTRFAQVAASDSASFVLTDDGRVYGWGTFRGNDGIIGFTPDAQIAHRPVLLSGLKDITSIKAGSNHCYALDTKGKVYSWGAGQQDQLGRRVIERTAKAEGLKPREFGLPKGKKNSVVAIDSGAYHGFALTKTGDVYAWGLNNMGETGIPYNAGVDDATIRPAQVVDSLKGQEVVSIHGGMHHSIAATRSGDCLVWGRVDAAQMGIPLEDLAKLPSTAMKKDEHGKPRILLEPQKVPAIKGAVTEVTASSDHCMLITKEGKAWSWGFSASYQTGQGTEDDVIMATMIDNTAVREKKIVGACAGGQYGLVVAAAGAEMGQNGH